MEMTYDEMQSVSAEILEVLSGRSRADDEAYDATYESAGESMTNITESKISQIVSETIKQERVLSALENPQSQLGFTPRENGEDIRRARKFREYGQNTSWSEQVLSQNINSYNSVGTEKITERESIKIVTQDGTERSIAEEISENIRRDSRRYDATIKKY